MSVSLRSTLFNKLHLQLAIYAWLLCSGALTYAQEVTLTGPLAQGGFIIGHAPQASRIVLNDTDIRQAPTGHFAFGFGRDAGSDAQLVIEFADGTRWQKTLDIAQREYQIQRVNGVPQRTVTPDPKHLKRIRDEAARVRTARRDHHELNNFLETFVWPAQGPITGVYGSQRFYNGEPRSPHYGVDVAGPAGTPVVAPAGGVVTLAEPDLYFSGGTLIIDHGYGISSTFLHLSALHVKPGDRISQGEHIADIGKTGRATGPHLDWRMNWYHVRLDPQLFMPPIETDKTQP